MKLYCATLLCFVVYLCYMDVTTAQEVSDLSAVDRALTDDRAIDGHVKCLLDKATCRGPQVIVKRLVKRYFASRCANCPPVIARGFGRVTEYMKKNRPSDYAEIEKIYG